MVIWHHISEGNYFSRGRWFHPAFVHVGPHHSVLGVANFGASLLFERSSFLTRE